MSLKGSITTADYLPFSDYQRLVQTLINERKYWWACYCIISFCTGLRFSDVSRLRWIDVLDQKNIIITAKKTGKTHLIPIGNNASEHISTLYKKMKSPNKNGYIMASQRTNGKPMNIQYVNAMLKRWVKQYNLDIENFSTHTFRKTFGRYVYEKNGRSNEALLHLNRIFKHTNLNTTMIYLGIRDEEIAGIFNTIEI